MDRETFLQNIEKTYSDGVNLIKVKNADYANTDDPFQNFRNSTASGVILERGILVRVMDKITRIANLLDRPPMLAEERIVDSLLDAINYLAILKVYIEGDKSNDKQKRDETKVVH